MVTAEPEGGRAEEVGVSGSYTAGRGGGWAGSEGLLGRAPAPFSNVLFVYSDRPEDCKPQPR